MSTQKGSAAPATDTIVAAEEDFPRGGGGALSALERKQLQAEAEADAARDFFSHANDGGPRKRRKKAEQACTCCVYLYI